MAGIERADAVEIWTLFRLRRRRRCRSAVEERGVKSALLADAAGPRRCNGARARVACSWFPVDRRSRTTAQPSLFPDSQLVSRAFTIDASEHAQRGGITR